MISKYKSIYEKANYRKPDPKKWYILTDKPNLSLSDFKGGYLTIYGSGRGRADSELENVKWYSNIKLGNVIYSSHNSAENVYELSIDIPNVKSLKYKNFKFLKKSTEFIEFLKSKNIFDKDIVDYRENEAVEFIFKTYKTSAFSLAKTTYVNYVNFKKVEPFDSLSNYDNQTFIGDKIGNLEELFFKDLKLFMSMEGKNLKPQTIRYFSQFILNHPITLYRGMSWSKNSQPVTSSIDRLKKIISKPFVLGDDVRFTYSRCSSWTTNEAIAEEMVARDEYWIVVEKKFQPKDIAVDTRIFSDDLRKKLYSSNQREVIVKPGSYDCKLITIGDRKKSNLKIGWKGLWLNV